MNGSNLRWLGWTQQFLHNDMPRYSLYSFERVPSAFEMNHRYFEGVGNYSLFFFLLMLISLLLVTASVLVLHVNIIDYNPTNVFLYKLSIFIFGFIAFLATIVGFVGFTMTITSLRKAVKDQLTPALNNIQEFNGYVVAVGDYAFGLINITKTSMAEKPESGSWFDSLADKAKEALALPVLNQLLKGEVYVNELKTTLKEVIELIEILISLSKSLLLVGIIFVIFTLFVCIWMASSSLSNAGTGPFICRVSTFVLMIWWLIGGAMMPFLLMLADTCYHPMAVVAKVCNYIHPNIDPNLIFFYGDCKEPNPIQTHINIMYDIATYVVGPLGYVIETLGLLAPEGNVMKTLTKAKDYMVHVKEYGGCEWSEQQSKIAFADICTNMIMGLAFFNLAAVIIASALTIAVMSCIRLREFKGWPKKKERLFPCPSTCHIHKERREPLEPCHPIPKRSEIIWPKPKEYDRRITCPVTCRGHDKAKAALDLRATCGKKCRGMLPRIPPPPPPVIKRPPPRKLMKKYEDKIAVCCIEVYKNNECVQEAAICKCHEGQHPNAECDSDKCKSNLKSKTFLGTCGLYKCRFTKMANKRKRKQKVPKPKTDTPTKEPNSAKQSKKKKSVVKCGIDRCKQSYKSVEQFKNCRLSTCKKNKLRRKGKKTYENIPVETPAEPVNPVTVGPVKERNGLEIKDKCAESKKPKISAKGSAKPSNNPAEGLTAPAAAKEQTQPDAPVPKPEDKTSKKSKKSKK